MWVVAFKSRQVNVETPQHQPHLPFKKIDQRCMVLASFEIHEPDLNDVIFNRQLHQAGVNRSTVQADFIWKSRPDMEFRILQADRNCAACDSHLCHLHVMVQNAE